MHSLCRSIGRGGAGEALLEGPSLPFQTVLLFKAFCKQGEEKKPEPSV